MANDVKITFDGDSKPAERSLDKLIKKQQQMIEGLQGAAKHSKKTADSVSGIEKAFKNVGTAIVGSVGIAGALRTVMSLTNQWEQHLQRLSGKVESVAKGMTSFALLQEGGTKAARVRSAASLGARYGIAPSTGEAFNTVQAMQSLPGGTFESGMRSAEAIFQGRRLGMNMEGLRNVAAAVHEKGVAPYKGIALTYLAGQASHRDPDTLTKTSTALPFWDDPSLAFAAAIPTLASTGPEEYQTYLRQAGRALQSEQGATGKLWSRLGVSGKSQRDKLAALHGAGYTTAQQFEASGISEIRQSVGLAAISKSFPFVEQNYRAFEKGATRDMLGAVRSETEMEVPQIRAQARLETIGAQYETAAAFSSLGMRATIQKAEDVAYAKRAQEKGWWFMEKEEGRTGPINRAIARTLHPEVSGQFNVERAMSGVSTGRENASAAGYLQGQIRQAGGQPMQITNVGGGATPMVPRNEVLMLVDALNGLRGDLKSAGVTEVGSD